MNSDDHAPEGFWRRALAAGAGYHLLVLLLIVFILQPLVGTRVNTKLMEAFTAGVFGLALAAVASHRRVLLAGVLLFVPTVVMGQLSVGSGALDGLARDLLSVAFLALMIGAFLSRVLRHREVTAATISGAISVYLFLGIAWGFAFDAVAVLDSGAFDGLSIVSAEERAASLFYFSFITLTTLGFGDIVPMTRPARSLAMVEAIVGQLYLVVLVARFVGIYVADGLRYGMPGLASPSSGTVRFSPQQGDDK